MEGILKTQGSQDISPPKDTGEAALPAQAPEAANANTEQPAAAAAAPEDASPILENEPKAAPLEEAGQALDPEASIPSKMTIILAKAVGEGPRAETSSSPLYTMGASACCCSRSLALHNAALLLGAMFNFLFATPKMA